MSRRTPEERLQIVQLYYASNNSVRATFRALRPFYGVHNRPTELQIRRTVDRFCSTFTLCDNVHPERRRTVRTPEAIENVRQSVEDDASVSFRRRAQQLNLCPSTLWTILRRDIGLKAYKIQLVQELKPNDHRLRRTFGEWAEGIIADDNEFPNKILFSDEAHFWLNGYVSKQNCRLWSEENPQAYVQKPLHPDKITVWCSLWSGGVIGPYVFRNDEGENVTVNGERYRSMISNFLVPQLQGIDIADKWFQQDGATCHTARQTIELLRETFGDRIISRNGPVNKPPRSCDLTPLDYFLWGYVKSKVYADKPATIQQLEINIRRVIAEIQAETLLKVCQNWTARLRYIRASCGGHMPEIIFKY